MQTILAPSTGVYKSKGSKFLGFAFPVSILKEIKQHHDILKENYTDATHICYAYRLYIQDRIDDFSADAGEPNGSAGNPILNSLKRKNLVNTVLYIIRYFGGSKLGIPGLIKSYGLASENTLLNSNIIQWQKLVNIQLEYGYEFGDIIENTITTFNGSVFEKKFEESVWINVSIPVGILEEFQKRVMSITNGSIKIKHP